MEIKTISGPSLKIIDQYLHFSVGNSLCSIPYYNNKIIKKRWSLRTYIGKGSPEDIKDELNGIIIKNRIDSRLLTNQSLKKLLVDNDLGIECSGFCYHVLEAESQARGLGLMNKKINFIKCKGLIRKIKCYMRPVENCDVETFASDINSKIIPLKDIRPGDIITVRPMSNSKEHDHILLVREVEYENSVPQKILYSHSIAYPEDGIYNTGVRNGYIEITNISLPITEANWIEENRQGYANLLFVRANKSKTEVRRLKWFFE